MVTKKKVTQQPTQPEKETAFVVDTNVLVHDPQAIHTLREGGKILVIPWVVLLELDQLKGRPDIGLDAREARRIIEKARIDGDDSLRIFRHPSFRTLSDLDKKIPDHQIVATAKDLMQKKEFKDVRLISRDSMVRILAREVGVKAEDYRRDQVIKREGSLKKIDVSFADVDGSTLSFPFVNDVMEDIQENEGVVCYSDFDFKPEPGEWKESFAAIRKGDRFRIILPGISAFGLKPYSLNGNGVNWHQHLALAQLLDPEIKLVFLQGGTGSGKTLLAMASAVEQRKMYQRIVVTRPMVPLEDEDRMGFLPGDEKQKMSPWLRPIMQAIRLLKKSDADKLTETSAKKRNKGNDSDSEENSLIMKLLKEGKIAFESLDYVRGMTYPKTFLVVDESQNLTPHKFKTIITRGGIDTKIVFTGDLGQIDRSRRLDITSSGLAYAVSKMSKHPSVGVTTFKDTVRSPLASLAEERM